MSKSNPMWGGRFDCSPNKIMEDINASISFDKRLAEQDILASKVHCSMLAKQKIISDDEARKIVEGLDFLQNNNQQLVATCRKIRSDVAKFIEQAMAERRRENLRGGVGMTAEGSGHETKSGNCSSSCSSKIEIV